MIDKTSCPQFDEMHGCLDCYIEHCPYDSNNFEEEDTDKESTKTEKPSLLIFRINECRSRDDLKIARKEIIDQIKEGVVLLPPYTTVETVIPADCAIRIVDKDGNVIEGGVIK